MADLDAVKDRIDAGGGRAAPTCCSTPRTRSTRTPSSASRSTTPTTCSPTCSRRAGLAVEPGAYGLRHRVRGRAGTGGPRDRGAVRVRRPARASATPAGTTSSAPPALGAGLAAAALAEELGGTVVVLGTPAEEGGGGKVFMAERGAFEGVDAAMMVHPAGARPARFGAIAIQQLEVTYHGRAAHAAAAPQMGRNALDAAVLGYMNVAALRQHIRPDERIHGIFTEAGDAAERGARRGPRPSGTSARPRSAASQKLKARVLACLEAGCRRRPAARWSTHGTTRPTPTWSTTTR